jgi:hypothetical protein
LRSKTSGGISGFRRHTMKNSELLEELRKAVKEGRIRVNTNSYGYIQLINTETGEKVVIGNIGGEEG